MSNKSARMSHLADLMAVELNEPPAGKGEPAETPKSIKAVLIKI